MSEWTFIEAGAVSRSFGDPPETRGRLTELRAAMANAGLDGLYLERFTNVAWVCGGRGNRVVLASELGACAVMVGANGAWLLVPNNEEARCRAEVFEDLPLPVVTRAWWDLPLHGAVGRLLPAGARWAADIPVPGASPAEPLVAPLRRVLGAPDMERFRALGEDAASALEAALVETNPEWQELHVAAAIMAEMKARDVDGSVVLVGGVARAERFRHFVPTAAPVGEGLLASVTATRHGLSASVTRSVNFGPLPLRRRDRHHAVVSVDGAYLGASRPGAELGAILTAGEAVFTDLGYYDEWKEHHQGGTTGYEGREVFAVPGSEFRLAAGMAVAWNPTVPGAKSEDTLLIGEAGLEMLTTAPASPWPLVYPEGEHPALARSGILVL